MFQNRLESISMHELGKWMMKLYFLMLLEIFLVWTWFMGKWQWCVYFRSFKSAGRTHVNSPSLTSSIHNYQKRLITWTKLSFHKTNLPCLLSKSNHPRNYGLSSEEVLATSLPYYFHHSHSLRTIPLPKSLLMLSAWSCRNTGDLVGALGHPVDIL